jgi:hypothetical protein
MKFWQKPPSAVKRIDTNISLIYTRVIDREKHPATMQVAGAHTGFPGRQSPQCQVIHGAKVAARKSLVLLEPAADRHALTAVSAVHQGHAGSASRAGWACGKARAIGDAILHPVYQKALELGMGVERESIEEYRQGAARF